jgi:hypothetical protein
MAGMIVWAKSTESKGVSNVRRQEIDAAKICAHPLMYPGRDETWTNRIGERKIFCSEVRAGVVVSWCDGCEYRAKEGRGGAQIIADDCGFYPERMGAAGKEALKGFSKPQKEEDNMEEKRIDFVRYKLNELYRTGQERVRLTEQLQTIVSDVLDEIADSAEVGDEIALRGYRLRVADLESNIGSWRTVVLEDNEGYRTTVFNDNIQPGSNFYLHNDFQADFLNASRGQWLFVANNLPRIIESFAVENEKVIDALRGAFEKLRSMAK